MKLLLELVSKFHTPTSKILLLYWSRKNVLCKFYLLPHVVACETKLIAFQFLNIIAFNTYLFYKSTKSLNYFCETEQKPAGIIFQLTASSSTHFEILKTWSAKKISEFILLQYVSPLKYNKKAKQKKKIRVISMFSLLRAAACKNQESADKRDFMDFFIFCPEKPFGELLLKTTIKLSKEFSFLRNLAKREMSCSGTTRH